MSKQSKPESSTLDTCLITAVRDSTATAQPLRAQSESAQPASASAQGPQAKSQAVQPGAGNRDMVLSHREAEAGSPADIAACGEEDPGSALESLVTRDQKQTAPD